MSVNFILKDKNKEHTSIYAIIRYKGERYKIGLRETIETQHWNNEKKRLRELRKYPDSLEINIRLDKWENTLNKVLNEFSYQMKVPTNEEFIKALEKEQNKELEPSGLLVEYLENFIPRSGRAGRTKLSYGSTKNLLISYEKEIKSKLHFEDINMSFYKNFKKYLEKKGKSKNYFGTMIKNIKLFMEESKEEGLHNSIEHRNKKFRTTSETADSVYLTEDELLKIYNLKFTEDLIKSLDDYKDIRAQNLSRKIEALNHVRNRFLIGAYTALRVSDFNRLGEINLDNNFIRIKPAKGATIRKNDDVIIPIHWIIKEILENGFDFTKTISDQKINKHIKEICQMAEINSLISSSRTEGGKLVETVKPKYELITTHTARRSGATNMFNAEIPSIRIMKITGHKTEKAFMKYIKISQEENAKSLADHPFFQKQS